MTILLLAVIGTAVAMAAGGRLRRFEALNAVAMADFTKTIELRNGPLCGKRVTVPSGDTQAMLPVNAADMFGAWAVYRPSSERCADGTEIWTEYVESQWGDTGLADL